MKLHQVQDNKIIQTNKRMQTRQISHYVSTRLERFYFEPTSTEISNTTSQQVKYAAGLQLSAHFQMKYMP